MSSKTTTHAAKPASSSITTQAQSSVFRREVDKQPENPLQQSIWQPSLPGAGAASPPPATSGHNFANIPVLAPAPINVQAKLTVGEANDKYEQEADAVADQVMRMPEPTVQGRLGDNDDEEKQQTIQTKPVAERITPLIQRETFVEADDTETVQGKSVVQRQLDAEEVDEEETVQAKPIMQRQLGAEGVDEEALQTKPVIARTPRVSKDNENYINSMRGKGQPLAQEERDFFEPRFAHNLGHVRIHADGQAAKAARQVNAQAFTVGNNIFFGANRYQIGIKTGRRLLAHELTHVVQQTGHKGMSPAVKTNTLNPVSLQAAGPNILQRTGDLAEVLRALEAGDSNVDTLAAQLSDEQMAGLSTSNRLSLIRHIANGYSVANEDEQTILRLLRTTPAAQRVPLIGAMDATLLQRLELVMHGEEYRQYHVLLRGLFFGARSAAQAVQEIESARTFPWADPGLIRAIWNVRFYYEVAEFTEQGRIRFVYWNNIAFMGVRNEAIEVDPMEMILVRFYDDETEADATRGQVIPMPAVNLLSLVQKQFRGEVQTVADIALVGLGGAGVIGASTRLGRVVAALELAFGVADVVIRDFRAQIARSELGREFLAVWDIISVFIAIYGFTRIALEGGRLFLRLRRAWRALRGSDEAARLGDQLDTLGQQVDEMLDRADEARAAQQGSTPGTTPAAEVPAQTPGTTPIPEGPTQTPGTTPAAGGPTPITAAELPAPRARVDVRNVPLVIRTRSGVEVAIDADRLEHVLRGHTIENFDPVARAAEIAGEAPTHLTTFFRRGTVTNPRELYTLIRQALEGTAGRAVTTGANNRITLMLRNHRMEAWIGPVAGGGGMRLNSIYPLASTGRNLTAAQIRAYAAEINAGTRTLDQIRAEVARLLQLR